MVAARWFPGRVGGFGTLVGAALVGACGPSMVAPQRVVESPVEVIPEALPSGPYAALLALPQTLHYVVDEGRGVACHLRDAGISGVTRAFTVDCESAAPSAQGSAGRPAASSAGAWCLSETYFGGIPSAPASWRSDGCYVVAPDGLWHLATCPATRGALGDLVAAGGVRVLGVDGLPVEAGAGEDARGQAVRGTRIVDGVGPVEVACVKDDDAGMTKAVHTQVCTSPVYAYLEASGRAEEMELLSCEGASRLVAVEPGIRPPRGCLVEPLVTGAWSVVAKTFVAGAPLGKVGAGRVGALAQYDVVIAKDAACALTATVTKVAEGGKRVGAKKASSGSAPVALGCSSAAWGPRCFTAKVAMKDSSGRAEALELELALPASAGRGPMLVGAWRGAGGSGLVQGDGLEATSPLLGFDDALVSPAARCEAVAVRLGDDGARVIETDAYQACLHGVGSP